MPTRTPSAISQAATSMLTELVIGKTVDEAAALEKDDLLAEMPVPLTPVRLKCAILGLTTPRWRCTNREARRSRPA
jgi:NifU-like protein involved in Fe-S cluster formation